MLSRQIYALNMYKIKVNLFNNDNSMWEYLGESNCSANCCTWKKYPLFRSIISNVMYGLTFGKIIIPKATDIEIELSFSRDGITYEQISHEASHAALNILNIIGYTYSSISSRDKSIMNKIICFLTHRKYTNNNIPIQFISNSGIITDTEEVINIIYSDTQETLAYLTGDITNKTIVALHEMNGNIQVNK